VESSPEREAPLAVFVSASQRVRAAFGRAAFDLRTTHAPPGIGWQEVSCVLITRVNLFGAGKDFRS